MARRRRCVVVATSAPRRRARDYMCRYSTRSRAFASRVRVARAYLASCAPRPMDGWMDRWTDASPGKQSRAVLAGWSSRSRDSRTGRRSTEIDEMCGAPFAPCRSRRPPRVAPRPARRRRPTPRSAATTDAAARGRGISRARTRARLYMGDCVRIIYIVGETIDDEWPCATLHGRLRAYYRVGETIDDEWSCA